VRRGNAALAQQEAGEVGSALAETLAMLEVFGLNPLNESWQSAGGNSDGRATGVIDALVTVVLNQRQEARGRKDFAAADALRDGLDAIGIRIEDTAQGVRWSLDG
jgi:cysteinyl-tRNA synthetase